ncbi:low molecular weight phosphotyrosine protein phosphatase [Actinomycetaceae bacterium TAE3-ERU4]|nr:low molecular weight phosphotyrosine protein phosphatase [Actinomycetaceae bacterium TAE3-ERU4]
MQDNLTRTNSAPRVLMVCTGNICRSAMAHVMLDTHAKRENAAVLVSSCGISNEEHGNPIDYRAAQVLRESGYEVPAHQARQITDEDIKNSDLILAMTAGHYRHLEKLIARLGEENFSGKLRMLRDFEPSLSAESRAQADAKFTQARAERDVPDPWYGGMEDFWETYETLERCLPEILGFLPYT